MKLDSIECHPQSEVVHYRFRTLELGSLTI